MSTGFCFYILIAGKIAQLLRRLKNRNFELILIIMCNTSWRIC